MILDELKISHHLKDIGFIERIIDQTIDSRAVNITLSEPIGPSLKELFLASDKQFSVKTVLIIGLKLVNSSSLFAKKL